MKINRTNSFDKSSFFYQKAFKSHKLVDVFQSPGDCDLTADVDFLFLKHIALKSKSKIKKTIKVT